MTDDVRPAGGRPAIGPPGSGDPAPHPSGTANVINSPIFVPPVRTSEHEQAAVIPSSGWTDAIEFSGWAQSTVIYLGSAIASGVLGNVAYDGLKAALGRLRRGKVSPDPGPQDPDLVLLARAAVHARCADLGLDEQAGADVNAVCSHAAGGWEVLFRGRPDGVTASVRLSVDDQRADVKAEVRLPQELISQPREVKDDGAAMGVLRSADGWERQPPA